MITIHDEELMIECSPFEVFKLNGEEVICIPASSTKNKTCYCADCVFNDSGVCDRVFCNDMFFVYTDDIPPYVINSPELSRKISSAHKINKVEELIGKDVTITKLKSVRYKDGHPNNIEPGHTVRGELIDAKVGGAALVLNPFEYFHTSRIEKIEDDLIYTRNSVYKVEEFIES